MTAGFEGWVIIPTSVFTINHWGGNASTALDTATMFQMQISAVSAYGSVWSIDNFGSTEDIEAFKAVVAAGEEPSTETVYGHNYVNGVCDICYDDLRIFLQSNENELTLGAGETGYYASYTSGVNAEVVGSDLTVSHNGIEYQVTDSVNFEFVSNPMYRQPGVIAVTNNRDAEATFSINFVYPVGSQDNPEVLTESGEHALESIADYYYTFTAPSNGTVTVTMLEGNWQYCINNLTTYRYGDSHYYDDDTVVASESIEVSAGNVISIMIAYYDGSWQTTSGDVKWSFTFEGECAHEFKYDCDSVCSLCGETVREASHSYFYACDAHCEICGELTNEDAAHSIGHVDAVEATCQATGNIEYWYCEYCGVCWADEALTLQTNLMSIVTYTDHVYENGACKWCGEADPDAPADTLVSTEVYKNVSFEVYEKADGTNKLVISGAAAMPTWTSLSAYDYISTITEVVVEEGITSLPGSAFKGLTALTTVSLPSTVTVIPALTFNNCTALAEFEIPSTITEIGNKAFLASGITSVTIPDGVLVGTAVWMNCKSLTSANIGAITWTDTTGKVRPWVPQQCFANCSRLTEVTFSSKVTAINKSAFSKTGFTEISIPGHIRSVADSAFASCASLTSLTLEEGVRSLGYRAMGACAKLTEVNFNSSEFNAFGAGVFVSCYALEEIEIPALITKITADMFYDCKKLSVVDMSASGVTSIASRAFYKCVAMTEVKLPSVLTTIDKNVFYNNRVMPFITIPASVTKILAGAFNYCKGLETVYIDSATVVAGLTSNTAMGEVIRYADTVAINASITDIPTYITNTFTVVGSETVDGVEYVTYSLAE